MSHLGLHLLGPPRIERDGQPVSMDTSKAIALLAYIAITGESHRRDALVNLLWPEYDTTHGRAIAFIRDFVEERLVLVTAFEDDVSVEDKKRRLAELIAVQEEIWQAEAGRQKGARWQAVVEGEARRPAGHWRLRTANNRKVVVAAPELRVGETVHVTVTGHRNTTFLGDLLVLVIVREAAPILTNFVVIGRSGTAVAARLS